MVSPYAIAKRLKSKGFRVVDLRGKYSAPCPCCQGKEEAPPWSLTFEEYRQGTWLRCSSGCDPEWLRSLIGMTRVPKKDLKPCQATVFCQPPEIENLADGPLIDYATQRRRQRRKERANPYD